MTTLDIDDKVYDDWAKFYNKQDKLKYPTFKNFTARMLRKIMESKSAGVDSTKAPP